MVTLEQRCIISVLEGVFALRRALCGKSVLQVCPDHFGEGKRGGHHEHEQAIFQGPIDGQRLARNDAKVVATGDAGGSPRARALALLYTYHHCSDLGLYPAYSERKSPRPAAA